MSIPSVSDYTDPNAAFIAVQTDTDVEIMPKSLAPKSEDLETLRLKLRTTNRLIELYERRARKLRGKASTRVLIQEQENPQQLLEVVRDACIPIAEAGGPQSLIEDDLKAAQAELVQSTRES